MLKHVLVVEDDDSKGNEIIGFVKSINNKVNICRKESLNSALLEVSKNQYDIVILDMSLPTFDKNESEHFKPFGGLMFLSEVKRKKYSFPVVIVTQYATFGEGVNENSIEQIDRKCKYDYPNYKEIIYFLDETWKEKLKKYLVGEKLDKNIIC